MRVGNGRFDLGLSSHDTRFVPKRLFTRQPRRWSERTASGLPQRQIRVMKRVFFITNKYYKTPAKLLKSCVVDFYSVDALSEAKVRLLADINAMNSTVKFPHVSQHRDGDGRLLRELNDVACCMFG